MAPVLTFAYPGNLDTLTGGYLYDKFIIEGLEALGWTVNRMSLGDAFPFSEQATFLAAADLLKNVPVDSLLVIDGLALGAMGSLAKDFACRARASSEVRRETPRSRGFVALVHHPLALESGLTSEQSRILLKSEAHALSCAQHVIVNSPTTASTVQSLFKIGANQISTVLPGTAHPARTDSVRTARAPLHATHHANRNRPPLLLSVGSIVARKGYDILVRALESLKELDWELRIVGDPTRDPDVFESLKAQIIKAGLNDRIHLLGALEQAALDQQYAQADLFVLASHYEGYGMAYAQAMSWGLPIIGTTGGAIAETVVEGTGILVPPGDVVTLSRAIQYLLEHPENRAKMAHASFKHASALPSWSDAASAFAQALLKSDTQSTALHRA